MDEVRDGLGPILDGAGKSSAANILEFPGTQAVRYDPLRDADVLDMLRAWFKSGDAAIFPVDVECYRAHLEAVENLSDKEASELGLKVPCHMIRSPATEASQKVDAFRYKLGAWEMRVTNIIVGAWLFGRRVDNSLLQKLMPDSNFEKMVPKLIDGGLVKFGHDGSILPTRILLYRVVEQVVWLIDTIAPLVDKFCKPTFADKMAHWPPFDEEAPSCG